MLDITNIKHESKVVAITKEIEKTISPDKVTEMYDAIMEEVQGAIVKKFIIKSDYINGIIIEIHNRFDTVARILVTRFNLNGRDYVFRDDIKLDEGIYTHADLYERFAKHYTETIKREIMDQAARVILTNNLK